MIMNPYLPLCGIALTRELFGMLPELSSFLFLFVFFFSLSVGLFLIKSSWISITYFESDFLCRGYKI